jgi:deoxyribodipyrimidine photo-lyase
LSDRSSGVLAAGFPVTRSEALTRLAQFAPLAGGAYATGRNHDHGPGQHHTVSRLSAALARRTLSEAEVLEPVLHRHGDAADAFVREVFWRTYFRGWLEARPQVWHDWLGALDRLDAHLSRDDALAARHLAAIRGETGIDCFDHWINELASTGYLHNWSRMQVASIWIFTLGLPWELGARHFMRQLVDADAASNTLSWRWVAGLHTAGKAYLADASRIARMTDGRFSPSGLATQARIPDSAPHPGAEPPRQPPAPTPGVPTLLWITPADCALETEAALAALSVKAVAVIDAGAAPAGHGAKADAVACGDALERAAAHWQVPAMRVAGAEALAALALEAGARQVVTGRIGVGPGTDSLIAVRAALRRSGIALAEHTRAWDHAGWPHATRGFFALKEHIPRLLAQAGLAR